MSGLLVKTIVSVSQTRKVNLGNFESADIQVGISYESFDREEEHLLYARAADFVEEKMAQEVLTLQKLSVNPMTQKQAAESEKKQAAEKPAEKPAAKPAKEPKAKAPEPEPEAEDEVEEKPAKAAKTEKPAKAKVAEPEAEESEEKSEPTLADVKNALRKYAAATTKGDAIALMKKVTGVDASDKVAKKDYAKLLLEIQEAQEEI